MPIRLAIVDGHTLTRYGLRHLMTQHHDIRIVAECESAAQARLEIAATGPDVVTIDSTLPDGDGMRPGREFRDSHAELGLVMMTSRNVDDALFRAHQTGASAFAAKHAPLEDLLPPTRHAATTASSSYDPGLAV